MILFLDMDDVLVDFAGGACKAHGLTRSEFEAIRTPGSWWMATALGLSHEEFWEPMNRLGRDFWVDLKPLPWFDELMKIVSTWRFSEVYIVTAPHHLSPESASGKTIWLANRFGNCFNNYVLTHHKFLLAGPGRILVDDSEQNCRLFCTYGGSALLFPSHGNRLYPHASNPLRHPDLRSFLSANA